MNRKSRNYEHSRRYYKKNIMIIEKKSYLRYFYKIESGFTKNY